MADHIPFPSAGDLLKAGAGLLVLESGAALLNVLVWGWVLDHAAL